MQASIIDLRYNMKKVLKALERNEAVKVTYHGKAKYLLVPIEQYQADKAKNKKVQEHAFFGMHSANHSVTVDEHMNKLRGGRYKDI